MWADQITVAGGLLMDGRLQKPVSGYQIDNTISLSNKPVTADIDTAPTQNTAEPQTKALKVPMEGTALMQDTALEWTRPQDLLSPNKSAAAGTQVDNTITTNRSDLGASNASPSKTDPIAFPLPMSCTEDICDSGAYRLHIKHL